MNARKLPETRTDLLNGKGFAAQIVEGSAIAFWMAGRDDDTALFHLNAMHRNFAQLADVLGYDITPKADACLSVIEVAA